MLSVNLFSLISAFMFNSLFFVWLTMEVSMISFVVFISLNQSKVQSSTSMKYFCIQAFISLLILLSLLMMKLASPLGGASISLLLWFKLGGAPFHWWFISLVLKLDWLQILWVSTLQKLIPLLMLSSLVSLGSINLIAISLLITCAISLTQMSLKKILGVSSVFSLNWLGGCLLVSDMLWTKFLLVYGLLKMILILVVQVSSLESNKMSINLSSGYSLVLFFTGFLGLIGMPPLPLFFMKVQVLMEIATISLVLPALLMVSAMVMVFMYASAMNSNNWATATHLSTTLKPQPFTVFLIPASLVLLNAVASVLIL